MSDVGGERRYKAAEGMEASAVPDGYVVYDEANEKVHYLNPTAAVAFTLCDGSKSVDDIATFLKDAYDLGETPDLEALFTSLVEAGLVCPAE